MAINLTTFLQPAVEQAAKLAQIHTPDTNEVATDDPLMGICAQIAFAQVSAYVRSPLIRGNYVEIYPDVSKRVWLRLTPVVAITEIWDLTNDVELVETTDFVRIGNIVSFTDTAECDLTSFGGFATKDLRITYTGGVDSMRGTNHIGLVSAIALQSLAVYNRKDMLGMIRAQAKEGSEMVVTDFGNPDMGKIVEMAAMILDPLVYHGNAELLSVT